MKREVKMNREKKKRNRRMNNLITLITTLLLLEDLLDVIGNKNRIRIKIK